MSVCTIKEWLEEKHASYQRTTSQLAKSLIDYERGNYWYVVECIPAYQDMGQTPVKIKGFKGEERSSVIQSAREVFKEVYNDTRPNSIMQIVTIHFDNGYVMRDDDRDPRYD